MAAINASAAATLLEQRPEKNSGSEREFFSGLCCINDCHHSIAAMDKINFAKCVTF